MFLNLYTLHVQSVSLYKLIVYLTYTVFQERQDFIDNCATIITEKKLYYKVN